MSGLLSGIEVWQMALALVAAITAFALVFVGAMARFLKRPSPSEAIMRIGRTTTDVFIGRACWIVPVLHRAGRSAHMQRASYPAGRTPFRSPLALRASMTTSERWFF